MKKNNKGKIRLNANLALKLANSSKIEIKDISLLENETVDDALLRVSEVLATNDIELKNRAKDKGITVAYLEGACPVTNAFKKGDKRVVPVENPETIATAIRIGAPVSDIKA